MTNRPLECSQCKKPTCMVYKDIENGGIDTSHMCSDCPILKKKLYGESQNLQDKYDVKTNLCCGHCGTSWDSLQISHSLGCAECYNVFESLILSSLDSNNLIPPKVAVSTQKDPSCPLHIGRTPSTPNVAPISEQMSTLNAALNEAVKKENFEQAAKLRDQIRQLKDKVNEGA